MKPMMRGFYKALSVESLTGDLKNIYALKF